MLSRTNGVTSVSGVSWIVKTEHFLPAFVTSTKDTFITGRRGRIGADVASPDEDPHKRGSNWRDDHLVDAIISRQIARDERGAGGHPARYPTWHATPPYPE